MLEEEPKPSPTSRSNVPCTVSSMPNKVVLKLKDVVIEAIAVNPVNFLPPRPLQICHISSSSLRGLPKDPVQQSSSNHVAVALKKISSLVARLIEVIIATVKEARMAVITAIGSKVANISRLRQRSEAIGIVAAAARNLLLPRLSVPRPKKSAVVV